MTDESRPRRSDADIVAELLAVLDVEELDVDLYRGHRQPGGVGRVFGGQVIAQGLQAAQRSVEDKVAHSLHAYFMRPGDENFPITYRVVRDFDGGSFATRRVIAMQRGTPILSMTASFQRDEGGLHHQDTMPDVPPPEGLKTEQELRRERIDEIPERFRPFFLRRRPIEMRPCQPRDWIDPQKAEPVWQCWIRALSPLPDDPAVHRAVLAYASDMALMGTSMLPHGVNWQTPGMQTASLDHAVWLHEPFRADEWLLYACDSPWAGHARGFNRGRVYTRDGRLVASTSQEGLIRKRER
ncbi:acyl-CoA thioesterase [Sphingomonas turrisvirgatae]|uniref:Acyl-CoA thioesterase 2 n=1 Tax=Sphingomonas turrisvirgatae TaxID=1888892 RepID=A0A1E3LVB9_9SPHN|nr:acyl-CoA thioesterase II [Sphingomonas turrisvirgatae]ODP37698.1 acyl-CoA thioesterase II [Sphingomonas turrisvirgatae]